MNKILLIFTIFIFINNCSFNSKSKFWTKETNIQKITKIKEKNKTYIKRDLFVSEEAFQKELNTKLKIRLKSKLINHNYNNNKNNNGRINYLGNLKSISKYKFKKIKYFNQFEPELIFHNNRLIFFNNIGSIIKFDEDSDLIWQKNYYTKQEKKLNPVLFFSKNNDVLIVADNISKYYALNINTGELLWSKYNNAPFMSDVKIVDDKFFVVDSNNIIKCFSLKNGNKLWQYKSDNRIIKSSKKLSIAIQNNILVFNNSIGDINALDINTGNLIWLTPTVKNQNLVQSFLLKSSDLVIDNNSILFSNNSNEFFSINLQTGIINWIQKINSDLRPTVINNLIFTISSEGFLIVLDSETGNILRITDLFGKFTNKSKNLNKLNPINFIDNIFEKIPEDSRFYIPKKGTENLKKKFLPVGFIVGKANIYLTTSHGKLFVIDILTGQIQSILKIDKEKISRPFISNKNMFLVKENSIIKLN